MRFSRLFFFAFLCFSLFGCAAVFRDSHPRVHVDSDPTGADAHTKGSSVGKTPTDIQVERTGTSDVIITKQGYADSRGIVKKKLNPAWLTFDILDCIFPIALCIPLLVDAVSGAWMDVEEQYVVKLEPGTGTPTPAPSSSAASAPTVIGATPAPTGGPQMSESERKATARAAFAEGIALQEKNQCADALPRFVAAEKMFDAPTHVLHIAQCEVATGKLIEAQEHYETLSHANLGASPPDAFTKAQDTGKKELAALQPRIPSLRIQVTPVAAGLTNLIVVVNGRPTPNELIGIARPVNPGNYKIAASAQGYKPTNLELDLKEGELKTADVKLTK